VRPFEDVPREDLGGSDDEVAAVGANVEAVLERQVVVVTRLRHVAQLRG